MRGTIAALSILFILIIIAAAVMTPALTEVHQSISETTAAFCRMGIGECE